MSLMQYSLLAANHIWDEKSAGYHIRLCLRLDWQGAAAAAKCSSLDFNTLKLQHNLLSVYEIIETHLRSLTFHLWPELYDALTTPKQPFYTQIFLPAMRNRPDKYCYWRSLSAPPSSPAFLTKNNCI